MGHALPLLSLPAASTYAHRLALRREMMRDATPIRSATSSTRLSTTPVSSHFAQIIITHAIAPISAYDICRQEMIAQRFIFGLRSSVLPCSGRKMLRFGRIPRRQFSFLCSSSLPRHRSTYFTPSCCSYGVAHLLGRKRLGKIDIHHHLRAATPDD